MHPAAADHRRDDLDRLELVRRALERIAREHDEVGEVAGEELARAAARPARARPGSTQVATSASSTVRHCSGCHAGRSSIVRRTPARIPASGSSSSTGASEPFATSAPGLEQRAERVRAVDPLGPEALGEIAIRGRVAELHGAGDAELGEAADVLRGEALRVLDPLPQPERLPRVARRLERVERLAVRAVADRVHADRPAERARPRG